MPKLSDELKEAIKALSEKEKDKLLLRLIPKSSLLVQQLEFQLIEGSATTLARREELKDKIQANLDRYPEFYYSPAYLTILMRNLSGDITLHVNVTKDKFAEIEMNLLMIEGLLSNNQSRLKDEDYYKMEKFNEYIIKRMIKVMKLMEKIHEDYHTDYRAYIHTIGRLLSQLPTTIAKARYLAYDINILKSF